MTHKLLTLLILFSLLLTGCGDDLNTGVVATLLASTPDSGPTTLPSDDPSATSPAPQPTPTVQASGPVSFPDCISPNAPVTTGKVVKITDGDTIHVSIDGQEYTVRYISIDTPESTKEVEPYGPEAAEVNRSLVEGRRVTLVKDVSETDRFGRLLRYVFVGSTFVNYELVNRGYANAASFPPDVACLDYLRDAEDEARSQGRGLWAGTDLSAPCNCEGRDVDCADFDTRAEAQACFEYCRDKNLGDIFRLDGEDQDGRACESMP